MKNTPNALPTPGTMTDQSESSQPNWLTIRKFGIRNTNDGTNSVPTTSPKMSRRPANSMRASAYAAADDVATMSTDCAVAAIRLMMNHRMTGVSAVVDISGLYSSEVNGRGSQLSGNRIASNFVLNDVRNIQTSGATKMTVSTSNTR